MADLIVIGYPDENTAALAADEARQLARDLIIQPDAIATIVRDKEGRYHVNTSHHAVGTGATWGMFWGLLFGLLFFIPVFGMAIGAGMGALMGKITKSGVNKEFQDQVRDRSAGNLRALPHAREGDARQGRRRDEQVWRDCAEDLAFEARRGAASGSAAWRKSRGKLTGCPGTGCAVVPVAVCSAATGTSAAAIVPSSSVIPSSRITTNRSGAEHGTPERTGRWPGTRGLSR